MRVVFFGSPDFALPSLEALAAAGHEVALVVSQSAKPVGRHAVLSDPPVARRARELGIPLAQPVTLRDAAALEALAAPRADVFVVVAYGKILPQAVLDLPRVAPVNVHASLLPRWRGASPVQAALLAGDGETGVSIMRMEAGMDTGPVYAREATPVAPDEDAGVLSARLARAGAALLVATLPRVADASLAPTPQDHARATLCPKVRREDARVDWTRPADELARRARAFSPWPGLYCERRGARLKLEGVRALGGAPALPGEVLRTGEEVVVACGEGALGVARLQAEGRKLLPAAAFCRGERLAPGERLA